MFLSELIFNKPEAAVYTSRTFPEYYSASPPLHSIPGVICNTSNIWENILDISSRVFLKKGDILYPDIDGKSPIIYLKNGKVCIFQINEEGKVFTPHFIFSGSLIYDAFFITEGQFQTMPIKSMENSELYIFPQDFTFEDILNINPYLIKNLIYSQAVKDLCYSTLSCINMYIKPLNRVCMYIYEMYKIHHKKNIIPYITQAELALLLDMHKVTMSNIIRQLKEKNIIQCFTKTELIILDLEKLHSLALME